MLGLAQKTPPKTLLETPENQFFLRCLSDPRYFLQTVSKIRYQSGEVGPWVFNNIQNDKYAKIYNITPEGVATRKIRHTLTLKSRQYGESTWRLGLLYHSFCFKPGWVSNVIGYREATVKKLGTIIKLFHSSACEFLRDKLGLDPEQFLPTIEKSTETEIRAHNGSLISLTTEGAKGHGRSLTVNEIYGTELSEWENPEEVLAGFGGSISKDLSAIIDFDFSAKGLGNYAAQEWAAASDPDQESIFTPFFYGRNDFPYPPAFLEQQRKLLKYRFVQEYPATPDEAFLKDDNAIFSAEHIELTAGDKYWVDLFPDVDTTKEVFSHGCDPTGGQSETGSYGVIVTRHLGTGIEAVEPFRKKVTPRRIAHEIAARLEKFPGIVCIERNSIGSAVILECENLQLDRFLYVHDDGLIGWPENSRTKLMLEAAFEKVLEENAQSVADTGKQTHVIVSDNGRRELRHYIQRPDGSHGSPQQVRQKQRVFYDDEAIAIMLEIQARPQAAQFWGGVGRPAVRRSITEMPIESFENMLDRRMSERWDFDD